MSRYKLPNRRISVTRKVRWKLETGEQRFLLTIGSCPDTHKILEVFFADGQKSGSQLQHTIQDACVILSLLLQHGGDLETLGKSLSEVEIMGQSEPASIMGVIIKELCAEQQEGKK